MIDSSFFPIKKNSSEDIANSGALWGISHYLSLRKTFWKYHMHTRDTLRYTCTYPWTQADIYTPISCVLLQGSLLWSFLYIFNIYKITESVYAAQRTFFTSLRVNELVAHYPLVPLSTQTKTHTTTKPPPKSRKQHCCLPTHGPRMLWWFECEGPP